MHFSISEQNTLIFVSILAICADSVHPFSARFCRFASSAWIAHRTIRCTSEGMLVILLSYKTFRFDKAISPKKLFTHLDWHSAKHFQRSGKKGLLAGTFLRMR
jgi:hypothetical protein